MELFATRPKKARRSSKARKAAAAAEGSREERAAPPVAGEGEAYPTSLRPFLRELTAPEALPRSFGALGLCEWVLGSTRAMGFRKPTPVQAQCIPHVLSGSDVVGCAETGSGKTGAFALPLLHRLSMEPYGIFCVVLTPTRELALQISEQFAAFGAPIGLRLATVIGGVDMVRQSLELDQRPHVVVATPGRLADHIRGASPPFLRKAGALVLDEADRLMDDCFHADLLDILRAMPPAEKRQTLLFSATIRTMPAAKIEALRLRNPLCFDLTSERKMPQSLTQQYAFMPQPLKLAYLVEALNELTLESLLTAKAAGAGGRAGKEGDDGEDEADGDEEQRTSLGASRARSAIIFCGSCKRTAEVCETLRQLKVPVVSLHSMLGQKRRLAALGAFKSHAVKLLVATDVAARGLDLPNVDLVVHYDVPRDAADYVHRCGRTARAGRAGKSLALVTQYDVELIHAIEAFTEVRLEACGEVTEDNALKLLNPVSKALRTARMDLEQLGFNERHDRIKQRTKRQREEAKRGAPVAANANA